MTHFQAQILKKKIAFHRFDEEFEGEVGDNPAFSQAGAGRYDPIVWHSGFLCAKVCVMGAQ